LKQLEETNTMVDLTDLNTYLNGRLILDPPVEEILKDVKKIEWVPRSIDEDIANLKVFPGTITWRYPLHLSKKLIPSRKKPMESNEEPCFCMALTRTTATNSIFSQTNERR
jgi:hypothetical protein